MEMAVEEKEEEEEEGAVWGVRDMRHNSLWKVENSFSNASDIIESAVDSPEVLLIISKSTVMRLMIIPSKLMKKHQITIK